MKELQEKINAVKRMLQKQIWIIPTCFAISLALTAAGITLVIIRGFDNMENGWMFSIGADIFCMAVCVMLSFSCILNNKSQSEDTHVFATLLTANAIALFLDESSWLVQGIPSLRFVNLTVNVLFYINGAILIYLFWLYIRNALQMRSSKMKAASGILTLLLFPTLLLCLVNFVYPLYFSVNEAGTYQRSDRWYISQVYLVIALVIMVLALIFSKASKKDRLVAASFAAIPLLNQVITRYTFGISTQYAAMLVSIVLIYGVLFAEREKTIASTEMELGVATRIQSDMLPNTFPVLPERKEFDLFASMTPAKEVGGDFYDFFMIDDSRIALVMADVSGKGIPAALFMMSSKILIKNCVMTGQSPSQVLSAVNNQICENNREEMFVTVWLGILDLTDGTLTFANAGHEYPILKKPGGEFELFKSKHSFVIGGMKGLRYKEQVMRLEPDSKLFLYTDGVPEAENFRLEQYGYDRFLAALNRVKDKTPRDLLGEVEADVKRYTLSHPQFDDLTMLCIHYIGMQEGN